MRSFFFALFFTISGVLFSDWARLRYEHVVLTEDYTHLRKISDGTIDFNWRLLSTLDQCVSSLDEQKRIALSNVLVKRERPRKQKGHVSKVALRGWERTDERAVLQVRD